MLWSERIATFQSQIEDQEYFIKILDFSINDFLVVPLCLVVLYAIVRNRAERPKNAALKKIYYRGFYYKVFFVFAYTIVTELVFKGGDTNLYYQAIKDLRAALSDDFGFIETIATSKSIDIDHPLAPYFYYDNYEHDFTFNYMRSASNFFPYKENKSI